MKGIESQWGHVAFAHPERGRLRALAGMSRADRLVVERWAHTVLGCEPTREGLAPARTAGRAAARPLLLRAARRGAVPDDGRVVFGVGDRGPELVHDGWLRYGGSPGPDRERRRFRHPERGRRMALGRVAAPTGADWLDRRLFLPVSWADPVLGCEPTLAGKGAVPGLAPSRPGDLVLRPPRTQGGPGRRPVGLRALG